MIKHRKAVTLLASVLLIALVLTTLCASAFASSDDGIDAHDLYIVGRRYQGSFETAWEATASERFYDELDEFTINAFTISITYGYNTLFINEDYVWGDCEELAHWSTIVNANGTHNSIIRLPGKTAKVEVTHAGDSIYYACEVS